MKHWLGGVAAVLFGLAALVGAGGYVLGNLPSAEAQDFGPVVTGGENPYMSWSFVATTGDVDLVTVPADRVFVMTGVASPSHGWTVSEVGATTTQKAAHHSVNAWTDEGAAVNGYLAQGRGTVVFAPGTTVRLSSTVAVHIDLQGYLAAP